MFGVNNFVLARLHRNGVLQHYFPYVAVKVVVEVIVNVVNAHSI